MLLLEYLYWHFAIAPRKIWEIGANYMQAAWHRFLIVQHLKSLLAPWHRRTPSDLGKPKGIEDKIGNFVSDIYIRILAAFVRLAIVLTGLIYEVVLFGVFTLLFFVWVFWPLAAVGMIIRGVSLL